MNAQRNYWLKCSNCEAEFPMRAQVPQCEQCGFWYTLRIMSDIDGEKPRTLLDGADVKERSGCCEN